MKRIILFLAILTISYLTAFGQDTTSKTIEVEDFDEISVKNAINAELVMDGKQKIEIDCPVEYMEFIIVEAKNDKLTVKLDIDELKKQKRREKGNFFSRLLSKKVIINGVEIAKNISITVHAKHIEEISVSSLATIKWDGNFPTHKLDIDASSSAKVSWSGVLDIKNLDIDASSSSEVLGEIKARKADIDLSSSASYKGNIDSYDLDIELSSSANYEGEIYTEKGSFDLSSSAIFKGFVDGDEIYFDLSSSANANVEGEISELEIKSSSSADFHGKGITYKSAEVKTASNGKIYLSKSGKLVDNTKKETGVSVE